MSEEKKSNVLSLVPKLESAEQEEQERTPLEEALDALEQVKTLNPHNVCIIGLTEEGYPFIVDSTRKIANVSFLTDIAKALVSEMVKTGEA